MGKIYDALSDEQREHVDAALASRRKSWQGDWGAVIEMTQEEMGLTFSETVQLLTLWSMDALFTHIRAWGQDGYRARQEAYMEKAERFLDDSMRDAAEGDDWKKET